MLSKNFCVLPHWAPYLMAGGTNGKFQAVERSGSVALIRISGPLFYKSETGYAGIRKNLRMAMRDRFIKSVLLDIDSPGGEVAGVFDLVDEIYAARKEKPIVAISNESSELLISWKMK